MGIAVPAKKQGRRDVCCYHREYRISALPAQRPGTARFGQFQRSIQRHRHSAISWLDRAILPNGEITAWPVNPNAKRATGALNPGQPIRFRLHSSEHRLSGLAGACILHSILK